MNISKIPSEIIINILQYSNNLINSRSVSKLWRLLATEIINNELISNTIHITIPFNHIDYEDDDNYINNYNINWVTNTDIKIITYSDNILFINELIMTYGSNRINIKKENQYRRCY
jgi:hypothetical protein